MYCHPSRYDRRSQRSAPGRQRLATWRDSPFFHHRPPSLLVGFSLAGGADTPLLPLLALVVGVLIGATLIVVGIRRWLAGERVPLVLALISGATAIVAIVLISATDSASGPALLCGLFAGLMFANIWAIRAAAKHGETPSR